MGPSITISAWVTDLTWKDRDLWDRACTFLLNITAEDRVAVIYDDDGDGMSAAASVVVGLTRLRGKEPDYVMPFEKSDAYISDDLPYQLKKNGITKIITVDKTVDEKGITFMQTLEEIAPVLVIDHHRHMHPYSSPRFILLKPQIVWETEPSSFPTAILAYTLFSSVTDLSDKDWVASIGITSDCAYPRWKVFVDAAIQTWNLPPVPADPFEGPFGKMSGIIYATQVLSPRQLPELLELMVETIKPQDFLESGFSALPPILDDEVKIWMEKLKTEALIFPELELVIAKVHPRHGIKSLLVNKLSTHQHPNYSVLLFQDLGDQRVLISARRQDHKVPMNTLMEKAIMGLPTATGGGHVPAAAAGIRKQDEETFIENVKRLLATELKKK
ncbi:MAG: DHH family phosphoesterase [archaeon]